MRKVQVLVYHNGVWARYTPLFVQLNWFASARAPLGFLGSYGSQKWNHSIGSGFVMGGDGLWLNNFALGQESLVWRVMKSIYHSGRDDQEAHANPDPYGWVVL